MAETKGFMGGSMAFNTGEEGKGGTDAPLLPLRVLAIADLVPRDEWNAGASPPESAIPVDPKAFDEVFTRLKPRLQIEVASVLQVGGVERIDVSFEGIKSFRPDELVKNVKLLRSLLDGRAVLGRMRDGSMGEAEAKQELERLWGGSPFAREVLGLVGKAGGPAPAPAPAAAPAPAPAAAPAPAPVDTSVGSILDMVDMGGGGEASAPAAPEPVAAAVESTTDAVRAAASRFGDLIGNLVRTKPSSGFRPEEALQRIDKALGAQLGAILQHPEFRRLEEAWRGLKLLADRAVSVPHVRIDVVSARPDQAGLALARVAKSADPPITFAVVDASIDRSTASLARLENVAQAAEATATPAILGTSEALFGISSLAEIEALDNKLRLFEDKSQVPWQSTVGRSPALWVALVGNRVLSRRAYDKSTSRVKEAVIAEAPADKNADVWIRGPWVVGALAVQSFKDTQWAHRIVGAKAGVLGDLPVREVPVGDSGEVMAIPTETYLTTDTQRDAAKMGVLLLAAAPNSDAVWVHSAPTAYVPPPKRTYDNSTAEPEVRFERVSLVDQLFVARVAQFLRALCTRIAPGSDPSEVQPIVEAALWELLAGAPPGSVELSVKAKADDGGSVAVTLRPRRFLGVSMEEVSLEMPLGG